MLSDQAETFNTGRQDHDLRRLPPARVAREERREAGKRRTAPERWGIR
jgi:hypothetical protein